MSRHDVVTVLILAAGYAAGIWTALILPRIRNKPRHKETS
jgi:hypothetical protein